MAYFVGAATTALAMLQQTNCNGGSLPACISTCPGGLAFPVCLESCVDECAKPTAVLSIGNSLTFWNGGTHVHVQNLAASAGFPIDAAECTIGGATLGTLWRRTAPVNRCTLGTTPRESISTGDFDVVVLQEDMPELQPRQIPEGIEPFYEYARLFSEEVRGIGSTPLFYMAWEFQRLNWINQQQISESHMEMWDEIAVNSAPAGDSFKLAEDTYPGRWDFLSGDREHQSWVGSYIASCCIFAQLFGESPEGLDYIPNGSGISPDDALVLQRLAWDATMLWNMARETANRA